MLIATALAAAGLTLTDRASVTLTNSDVRIADVVRGSGGALARVVVARLPRGGGEVVLSRRAVAALIRRAVPGVIVAEGRSGAIALRAPRPIVQLRSMRLRLPEPPDVRAGDKLTLLSRAGPVTVERPVTALQPGRSGRRLFVRDAAGQVSSIQFVGESKP